MTLFVSDLHLGRPGHSDAAAVQAFGRLLHVHEGAETLVLLGDIADTWIEHRHLVPRIPVRFTAALAAWVDAGKRLLVFAGNHDPWHLRFFAEELGAAVVFDGLDLDLEGQRVHLHHGDGLVPGGWYRRLRPILRHRLPVGLYRMLPADFGMALAQRTSARTRLRHHPEAGAQQRAVAQQALGGSARDAVVYGHSHVAELTRLPEGIYANPGAWYQTQTFLSLTPTAWELASLTAGGVTVVQRVALPLSPATACAEPTCA